MESCVNYVEATQGTTASFLSRSSQGSTDGSMANTRSVRFYLYP